MSVYVGASRGELLAWMNEIIHPTQITKIEQCGTGAVYCQIIDSIYGDVPIQRLKFNARQEYEYLENFKILQKSFKQHQIDKPIPVDKLVKCRMQDNLEFAQWLMKFWEANNPGPGYDAQGRAGGMVPSAPPTASSSRAGTAQSRTAPVARARVPTGARTVSNTSQIQLQSLQNALAEIESQADGFEKERDFYFAKLRDIEVLVQARNNEAELSAGETDFLAKVSDILYSTADGFELPENGEGEELHEQSQEEEETF